MMEKNKAPR